MACARYSCLCSQGAQGLYVVALLVHVVLGTNASEFEHFTYFLALNWLDAGWILQFRFLRLLVSKYHWRVGLAAISGAKINKMSLCSTTCVQEVQNSVFDMCRYHLQCDEGSHSRTLLFKFSQHHHISCLKVVHNCMLLSFEVSIVQFHDILCVSNQKLVVYLLLPPVHLYSSPPSACVWA